MESVMTNRRRREPERGRRKGNGLTERGREGMLVSPNLVGRYCTVVLAVEKDYKGDDEGK